MEASLQRECQTSPTHVMAYPSIATVLLSMSCSRLRVLVHVGILPAPQASLIAPTQGSSPKASLRQCLSNFGDNDRPLTRSSTEINIRPTSHPQHRRICFGSIQRSTLSTLIGLKKGSGCMSSSSVTSVAPQVSRPIYVLSFEGFRVRNTGLI
ncbi:hypothetical protein BC834DRAFT_297116 [Gloeopeniophorella convolvens]|nr:hypothetical protein BC834DRAFT_297116 [Gloeopeniophorella convolvens]